MTSNTPAVADLKFLSSELSAMQSVVSVCVRRSEGGPHHELVCSIDR